MRASTCATLLVVLNLIAVAPSAPLAQSPRDGAPTAGREMGSADGRAMTGDLLTLAETVAGALDADRTAPMFSARAAAAREQAVAAGAMPDPALFMGLQAVPLDTFDLEQEPMTQVQLGLRQMFPRSGERGHRANQFMAQAGLHNAHAAQRNRLVRRDAGVLWLELFYWMKAESVVRDSEALFRQMVRIATSLYSQGKSNQADILRAELESNLLSERLLQIRQMQDQARAKLTHWLDDSAAARPLPGELPQLPPPPPLETLRDGLSTHPMLQAEDLGVEAGRSAVEVARSQFNTQWSLAVTYGHRPGTAPDGSEWADFLSIGVSTDLPFFTSGLQRRKLESSLREFSAAQAGREDALARLRRELNEDFARWSLLSDRLAVYDRDLLSLVRDHAEASLQAYQNDVVDFATLVRARLTELETLLNWWRLRTDLASAVVRLAYFQGGDER